MNKIICSDCLEFLKKIPNDTIDLIYLDPPFSSNKNYTGIWDKTKEELSFDDDYWELGIKGYIKWLEERIDQCFGVLKKTGSIYVHCDWHASHYIKVMMDEIAKKYGGEFRNEIIWHYISPGHPQKTFSRKHDVIFFYTKTKTNNYTYNRDDVRQPYNAERLAKAPKDENGIPIWNYGPGFPHVKTHPKGKVCDDVWFINIINSMAKERLGYPTQKPEKLLERIIKASSNPGDIVLDPFCGCGTTISVAAQLNRKFIGIDSYRMAIKVMDNRLKEILTWNESQYLSEKVNINSFTWKFIIPTNISDIKGYDWRNFQDWVCEKFGAMKGKRGADGGIDGWTKLESTHVHDIVRKQIFSLPTGTLIQSKHFRKGSIGEPHMKKFESTIRQNKKTEGIVVGWTFSKPAKEYVLDLEERGIKIYLMEADILYKQPTPKSPYEDSYIVDKKNIKIVNGLLNEDETTDIDDEQLNPSNY